MASTESSSTQASVLSSPAAVASRRNSQARVNVLNDTSLQRRLFEIRVMRLSTPLLKTTPEITNTQSPMDVLSVSAVPGAVYVGEVFRACISVNHRSTAALAKCTVEIEMQTSTKSSLLYRNDPAVEFKSSETKDYVVEHRVVEPGTNSLVVSVRYEDPYESLKQTPKSYKQFFNLDAINPFTIQTQVQNVAGSSLVEAAICNATSVPVTIENVSFGSYPCYTVEDLSVEEFSTEINLNPTSTEVGSGFDVIQCAPLPVMQPNDTVSHVFKLTEVDAKTKKRQIELGQIVVEWRHSMSSKLSTKSKIVHRTIPSKQFFSLKLIEAPAEVILEHEFWVKLLVTNSSSSSTELRLQIMKDRTVSVLANTQSSLDLGTFNSGEEREITVDLLPLSLGMQKLCRLRLTCPQTGKFYDFINLHKVVVVKKKSSTSK